MSRNPLTLDAASKIGTICVLLFAVIQYTIDTVRTDRTNARTASISYIERFSKEEVLDARLALVRFWNEREDIGRLCVGTAGGDSLPRESCIAIIPEMLEADTTTMTHLKRIGYFFDELYYCYDTEVCDREVVETFFCPYAIGNEDLYFQSLRSSDAEVFGRDLYTGIQELAATCRSKDYSA